MASPRARSRLDVGSFEVLNKILSLTAFLILMAAGWVALCYVKSTIERRPRSEARAISQANTSQAALIQASGQPWVQPVPLVYAASVDKVYFHNANHVPASGDRSALSEEAARRMGLKPCPVCLRVRPSQSLGAIDRRGASESAK